MHTVHLTIQLPEFRHPLFILIKFCPVITDNDTQFEHTLRIIDQIQHFNKFWKE